jgi:hypothetical protein
MTEEIFEKLGFERVEYLLKNPGNDKDFTTTP